MKNSLCALLGLALAACGGGGGNGNGSVETPICSSAGTFSYSAKLDGAMSGGGAGVGGQSFVNALSEDEPGSLELFIGDAIEAAVAIEFEELVADGDCVPARAVRFDLSDQGDGPAVANCAPGGETPGELCIDDDGEGGTFRLRELRGDASDPCNAPAVEGEIAGCFRYPERP